MESTFLFQMPIADFKNYLSSTIDEAINKALAATKKPEPEYLTIDQLRDYLPQNPAKQTVYQWVHFKKIPYHKRGKAVLFKRTEIDQWIESTRRSTLQEIEDRRRK